MTRNRKTIEGLIHIAKNCEESVFQKNRDYLKLKSQKNISTSEIKLMICRFDKLKIDFPEEKIYWNKRALEEKVGDKEQCYFFLSNLVFIYNELKEYELVLEYGKKPMEWLDSIQKNLSEDFKMINCMLAACKRLKRFEESIVYEKERLKNMVKSYKSGEPVYFDGTRVYCVDLLWCYKDLIDSQIRCKYFEGALKSFKKTKLFKLDSMNPDDVDQSMDQFAAYMSPSEQAKNFNVIGVLCELKAQALHGLGDKQNCQLWSELALQICKNLQKLAKYCVLKRVRDEITSQLVNTTLTIAELDLSKRRGLFNELVCYLFCETKHASFFIASCSSEFYFSVGYDRSSLEEGSSYRELKFDTVIPFIEHFLKCCTKEFLCKAKKYLENVGYIKKIYPNISLENQRKEMITYRNSLLIMKHFNSLP